MGHVWGRETRSRESDVSDGKRVSASDPLGPRCPAGDACENRVFWERLADTAKRAHEAWFNDSEGPETVELMNELNHIASFGPSTPCASDAELDSPNFTPAEVKDLAARGYERRGPSEVPFVRREAWTCDHEPKCATLAIHRQQGPRRERISGEAPASVSPSLDAESYTVRRFVLDHCAAIGAEYEADFRADLLRMLAEVRAERRSEADQTEYQRGVRAGYLSCAADCRLDREEPRSAEDPPNEDPFAGILRASLLFAENGNGAQARRNVQLWLGRERGPIGEAAKKVRSALRTESARAAVSAVEGGTQTRVVAKDPRGAVDVVHDVPADDAACVPAVTPNASLAFEVGTRVRHRNGRVGSVQTAHDKGLDGWVDVAFDGDPVGTWTSPELLTVVPAPPPCPHWESENGATCPQCNPSSDTPSLDLDEEAAVDAAIAHDHDCDLPKSADSSGDPLPALSKRVERLENLLWNHTDDDDRHMPGTVESTPKRSVER